MRWNLRVRPPGMEKGTLPPTGGTLTPRMEAVCSADFPPVEATAVQDGIRPRRAGMSVGSMIFRKLSEALPLRRLTIYAASYRALPSRVQNSTTMS